MTHMATAAWWLVCLCPGLAAGCGDEPYPISGEQRVERLPSAQLGEDVVLRIRTPPGMDSAGAYALVVQLDPTFAGLEEYAITAGLVSHHAANGDWPEAIVVGLDFDDPYRRTTHFDIMPDDRLDPAFGHETGADRLFAALRDEVLPHLAATLPVDPSRRILVGHSDGARFVWYQVFRHAPPDPPLFQGAIAADGGIDEELVTLERWHAERASDLPVRLHATRAAFNGPQQKLAFDALVERLQSRGFPSLALQTEALETDHEGAIVPSFERGLAFTLGGTP